MVNNILIFICLISQTLFAQKISCSGKLLDKNTQAPIFGVALSLNNNVLCYSDEAGNFEFETDKSNLDKSITFSHISYIPVGVLISAFEKGTQTIALTENTFELGEVVINPQKSISQKEILKKSLKQFDSNYRIVPYWTTINYKQTVHLNAIPKGYYECDAHVFMPGKNNSIFTYPMTIPNQVRRLNEDPKLMELNYSKDKVLPGTPDEYFFIGSSFLQEHLWLNYRIFEVAHPLSAQGKRVYDFKLIETSNQENSDCYVIKYKQKRRVVLGGWNIRNIEGMLWIDKQDFNLKKASTSFGFDKHNFNSFNIDYSLIESKLYPVKIEVSSFDFINPKRNVSSLVKNATVTFNKIDLEERKNYSKIYVEHFSFDIGEKYDANYWKAHPLNDWKYKNDVTTILNGADWETAFKKAAKEREYKENSSIPKKVKYLEKSNIALEKILKKDLNLK